MTGDRIRLVGYRVLAVAALITAVAFLVYSSRLASELAERERQRMFLWADAVVEVMSAPEAESVEYPMRLVEIDPGSPALLVDGDGVLLMSRNLPEDSAGAQKTADRIISSGNRIDITTDTGETYRICYGDSALLATLRCFPYIELLVISFFLIITYFAIRASRRAEENRIWVGLSRETAHQLGTPISSLMGWIECLKADVRHAPDSVNGIIMEMERDVIRLSDVSDRFSKIGACPVLKPVNLSELIGSVVRYMSRRLSSEIVISAVVADGAVTVGGSSELLRWVLENLIKNAVDAMDGAGAVTITLSQCDKGAVIDVADTGKGIPHQKWRTVFSAGYTTKGKGWGLGLTLARRIVCDYHRGSIAVLSSVVGQGTTFRIIIP